MTIFLKKAKSQCYNGTAYC